MYADVARQNPRLCARPAETNRIAIVLIKESHLGCAPPTIQCQLATADLARIQSVQALIQQHDLVKCAIPLSQPAHCFHTHEPYRLIEMEIERTGRASLVFGSTNGTEQMASEVFDLKDLKNGDPAVTLFLGFDREDDGGILMITRRIAIARGLAC